MPPLPGKAAPSSLHTRPSQSTSTAATTQAISACGPSIASMNSGNGDERPDAHHVGHVERRGLQQSQTTLQLAGRAFCWLRDHRVGSHPGLSTEWSVARGCETASGGFRLRFRNRY